MDRDALAVHQRHLVRKVSSALSRETGLPGNLLTLAPFAALGLLGGLARLNRRRG